MMRLEKFREYGSSASDCPTSNDFKSFNLYLYSTRGSTVTKVQINSILCEVSLKNMLLALSASNNFIEFACCPPLVQMNGVRLMRRFFHATRGDMAHSMLEKITDSQTVGQSCCSLLLVVAFATPNCNGWGWPANSARCGCFTSSLRPGRRVQTCHKRR